MYLLLCKRGFLTFSLLIWVKLGPIKLTRHLQHESMPFFPIASHFMTFLLRHIHKSKFWDGKVIYVLNPTIFLIFWPFLFLLFLYFCCSGLPSMHLFVYDIFLKKEEQPSKKKELQWEQCFSGKMKPICQNSAIFEHFQKWQKNLGDVLARGLSIDLLTNWDEVFSHKKSSCILSAYLGIIQSISMNSIGWPFSL